MKKNSIAAFKEMKNYVDKYNSFNYFKVLNDNYDFNKKLWESYMINTNFYNQLVIRKKINKEIVSNKYVFNLNKHISNLKKIIILKARKDLYFFSFLLIESKRKSKDDINPFYKEDLGINYLREICVVRQAMYEGVPFEIIYDKDGNIHNYKQGKHLKEARLYDIYLQSIAARHGKSFNAMLFITYRLGRDYIDKGSIGEIAYIGHSAKIYEQAFEAIKEYITDSHDKDESYYHKHDRILFEDIFPNITISKKNDTKQEFTLVDKKTNIKLSKRTTVYGVVMNPKLKITGMGFAHIFCDDLQLPNATATDMRYLDDFLSTLISRREKGTLLDIFHTRFSDGDAVGIMIKKINDYRKEVDVLKNYKEYPIGFIYIKPVKDENGKLMNVLFFDEIQYKQYEKFMNKKDFYANYLQITSISEYLLYSEFINNTYTTAEFNSDIFIEETICYVDPSTGKGQDHFAAVYFAISPLSDKVYIIDVIYRNKFENIKYINSAVLQKAKQYNVDKIYVEHNGIGFGIYDDLYTLVDNDFSLSIEVNKINNTGHKKDRISASVGYINQHFFLPEQSIINRTKDFNDAYKNISKFDTVNLEKGQKDDFADALAGAVGLANIIMPRTNHIDYNKNYDISYESEFEDEYNKLRLED